MATYILTLGALLPYPGQEHDDPKALPCHHGRVTRWKRPLVGLSSSPSVFGTTSPMGHLDRMGEKGAEGNCRGKKQ